MAFSTFLIAATLLAITPGPGIAYVVARTVAGGLAEGLASTVGTALGGLVHVLAAALGVSLVIAQSALAFTVLKYLGAAYLIYLGLRLLLSETKRVDTKASKARGARRALFEGVVVEVFNVKTALFFLAFLPQFVSPADPVVPQIVLLGAVCVVLNTVVDIVAVLVAERLARVEIGQATRSNLLTRMSGITVLGLGVFLAWSDQEQPG